MKIGLVLPGFSANEKDWCIPALLDHVRTLARANSVHVFALEYPYRRDDYEVFGAAVHSLNGGNRGKSYAPRLWAGALAAIRTEHRRRPFDVLHAFWANEPGLIALLASRALGIPFVASIAGGELASLRDIDYGGQVHFLERMIIRTVIQNAESVTVGSHYMRKTALLFRAGVDVQPLGIDSTRFSPAMRKKSNPLTILNVGSLVPVKGHKYLLNAIAELRSSDVCLEIIGAGPLKEELFTRASELGISSRVQFSGLIPHHLLADKYRTTELFVQAARHEAQGMALLEAAACGSAVVGTPVGVLPELAKEGAASTLRGMEPDDWASEIVGALEIREELSCRARGIVARDFDLEITCGKWTHLYQKMLNLRHA